MSLVQLACGRLGRLWTLWMLWCGVVLGHLPLLACAPLVTTGRPALAPFLPQAPTPERPTCPHHKEATQPPSRVQQSVHCSRQIQRDRFVIGSRDILLPTGLCFTLTPSGTLKRQRALNTCPPRVPSPDLTHLSTPGSRLSHCHL